ncbi:Retrovirus-related Pol polyprotein from transposon TNT 1-94 [Sesbania bispinosa]|nr:Retrovirus-related Pol polyprotein from transposon TNT 1-94 [Sesbania bispinosa]
MRETLSCGVATNLHPNLDAIETEPDNTPLQVQEHEHTAIETPIAEPDLNEISTQINETEPVPTDMQQ